MNSFRIFIFAVAVLTGCHPLAQPSPTSHPVSPAPLLAEAQRQFESMNSTLYQHRTEVDRAKGIFRYDCVGFVSYALKQATPTAWQSIVRATSLPKGRIPSPARYLAFFASLHEAPQDGWQPVAKVQDLRAGDIIAWEQKTEFATGHAVILAEDPVEKEGTWWAAVFDATSSPHSDDSRPSDDRAQILERTGKHSGLGHGVMGFVADSETGALRGVRWSRKAKAVTVLIAAGRALR
jgi:hypothetical protein